MCVVCVCVLCASEACVRIRIKGEKAPEVLLEFQDDERTQTFFSEVKRAKQQGKTPLSVTRLMSFDHKLLNQSSNIYLERVDYTAH